MNAQKRRNVQALKNQTRWETIATKMMGIFGLCFTGLGFHPAPYYQCIAHLVNGMYWITMGLGDMALKQLYDVGQDTSLGQRLYTRPPHKLRLEEEGESANQVVEVEGELLCQDDEKDLMIG